MFDRLQSWHRTKMLIECGRRCAGSLEERATDMKCGGFVADGICLETIAGRQQDRFGEAGFTRGRVKYFGTSGRNRERRAFIEAGGAMRGAERH